VSLTLVEDQSAVNTLAAGAAGVPFGGAALCRSFEVSAVRDPTNFSVQPRFRWLANGSSFQDFYRRAGTLVMDGDDRVLGFNGGQFRITAAGRIGYEEGFSNAATGRLVNDPVQVLSSDPAVIATACAEFPEVDFTVTVDQATTVTVTFTDTGTSTELFERTTVFEGAASTNYAQRFVDGTAFEVAATSAGGNAVCTITDATGTLAGADVMVDIDCAAPPP